MLVKNTEPRLISVGYGIGDTLGHDVIYPGVNDISTEKWNEMKKHPFIQHKLDEELLVELDSLGAAAKKDSVDSLSDFGPKKAVKLIESTVMPDLLEKWKASEKRDLVLKAIEKQLKKLGNVKRRDDDDKVEREEEETDAE